MNKNEQNIKTQKNMKINKTPKILYINKNKKINKRNKKKKNNNNLYVEKNKNEDITIPTTPKLTFSSSFNERLNKIGINQNCHLNNNLKEEKKYVNETNANNNSSFLIINNDEYVLFDSNSSQLDSNISISEIKKNNNLNDIIYKNSQSSTDTQISKINSQESQESTISLLQLPESAYTSNIFEIYF